MLFITLFQNIEIQLFVIYELGKERKKTPFLSQKWKRTEGGIVRVFLLF
jgi:hypothetical protein